MKYFNSWLRKIKPSVPPKSKLGEAINYTLNQWSYLIKYLRHGIAEIDTNYVENKIRDIALGRKNWLFMQHEDSGKIHALFYSLVLTCIMNKLNPRVYLHYILTKIHDLRKRKIDPYLLLPHIIDKKLLQQFSEDHLAQAKKILNVC